LPLLPDELVLAPVLPEVLLIEPELPLPVPPVPELAPLAPAPELAAAPLVDEPEPVVAEVLPLLDPPSDPPVPLSSVAAMSRKPHTFAQAVARTAAIAVAASVTHRALMGKRQSRRRWGCSKYSEPGTCSPPARAHSPRGTSR
jgi:hypothetical protein